MDYFRNLSGSFEKKVAALMQLYKESAGNIPYGEGELEKIQSKNELLEHYDITTTRMNRRIRSTVKYRERAQKELRGLMPEKEIDGIFAHCNGLILRGGYNSADHNRFVTLAAAIWILDQLSLQGRLTDAFPYLPEVDEQEPLCPYVNHLQYDHELIRGMVKLLLYRNHDSYVGLGKHQSTLFSDGHKRGKLRSDFDAVMALLDSQAIAAVTEKYEEKIWEFYKLIIPAARAMDKAYERLKSELEALQKETTTPALPACMVRPNMVVLSQDNSKNEQILLLQKKKILLQDFLHKYLHEDFLIHQRHGEKWSRWK